MFKFRRLAIYIVTLFITYLIYVYPFYVFNYFIFQESIFKSSSLYLTVIIYFIIVFCFRSNGKFFPLKLFVYEGMGLGFIGFWVVNLGLIVDTFNLISSHKL